MKKHIIPAALLLSLVIGVSCKISEPLTLKEYREIRQAILEGNYKEDFLTAYVEHEIEELRFRPIKEKKLNYLSALGNYAVVSDAVYETGCLGPVVGTWFGRDGRVTRRRMKRGMRQACRGLGYTYASFNKAHELYGIFKQTYSSEVRETKKFDWGGVGLVMGGTPNYYDHLMIDLLLTKEHLVSVEAGGKILFDGSEISPAEWSHSIMELGDYGIRLSFDKNASYADVMPIVTIWRDAGNSFIDVETDSYFMSGFCIVPFESDTSDLFEKFRKHHWPSLDYSRWILYNSINSPNRLKSDDWLALWVTPSGGFVTPHGDTITLDELDRYLKYEREDGNEFPAVVFCADSIPFNYLVERGTRRDALFYLCPPEEFEYYVKRSERINWAEVERKLAETRE